MAEKGGISVQTEHIFPVIKKWLYSDKDIFIRELVSNACDAITKHKRLVSLSNAEDDGTPYRIDVSVDKEKKTITVSDNGIGMSDEEVSKYINQIALSGALDFIAEYEGEEGSSGGIIGHFGLGFYSAFMVADVVEMNTKSYTSAPAVFWKCDSDGKYSMKDGKKETKGTEIVLHVAEDEVSYLDGEKIREILDRYCAFMPSEIYLTVDGKEAELINDTQPLWQRNPSELTAEDYNNFYRKVFHDYEAPLFYIHINADYPLNFKGVLFFPAVKHGVEAPKPEAKLFYNSVFVADNIEDVIPDYFLNVKGVLDCPELPLNVSRSYLQNNTYVKKLSSHITKKIADKITSMFNLERESYEKVWQSIRPYMQYACLRDEKFYSRIKPAVLFQKNDKTFATLGEVLGMSDDDLAADESIKKKKIYYYTDSKQQSYYVSLFEEKGITVYSFDKVIDTQFASFIESKNDKIKFLRVDSDLSEISEASESEELNLIFKNVCKKDADITVASLSEKEAPVLIKKTEDSRRMSEMMKMYGLDSDAMGGNEELVINSASTVCEKIKKLSAEGKKEEAELIAKYSYMLAIVASRQLTSEELKEFMEMNIKLLEKD
ncbi:MAG: molecular chaperone HtpG [Ruminococcaceae bacterium]|nr:molecular chaperone HtpG [Oscillospiraceae bacterium]